MTYAEALSHSNHDSVTRKIIAVVGEFPYRTSRELADKVNPNLVTPEQMHKRLPELRERGLIRNGAVRRRCTITGKMAQTWVTMPVVHNLRSTQVACE